MRHPINAAGARLRTGMGGDAESSMMLTMGKKKCRGVFNSLTID